MNRRQLLKSDLDGFALLCLPLSRCSCTAFSIPLFNCTVAGLQYYDGPRCIQTIRPGDRLDLVREPDNPYDEKAIVIHAPNDGKLGYLPRYLNEIPAALLDYGKKLHAFVNHADPATPHWDMLDITVVMA